MPRRSTPFNFLLPGIYIAPSGGKGRGVYTSARIPARTLIEVAPVIVMSGADRVLLDQTLLHDYIFEWGESTDECCMALGYVPLYNHSYRSNCEYEMDFRQSLIKIKTVRPVEAAEELVINYNGDWNNGKPLWFDAK